MIAGRRRSDRCLREKLRSPGRPGVGLRETRREFWAFIAQGLSSEDAAMKVGISPPVGSRWFRTAGEMAPSHLSLSSKSPSTRYLPLAEREEIATLQAQGHGVREVARRLGRAVSTISRELRRNAATRSGGLDYRATTAQWHAERAARRPKPAKLAGNAALRTYVQDRLAGAVATPSGSALPGPSVAWKGRRHGRRQSRRWGRSWSPQQIAERLRLDFPDDPTMRISHEAIYQALYIQGRGALKRELTACLRTERALRVPRARCLRRGKSFITPEVLISERPPEVEDRAVPGSLGRRPDPGSEEFGDRDPGRAHDALYDAAASSADGRPWGDTACQERPGAGGARGRGGPRGDHRHDRALAGASATLIDLGPGAEMAEHARLRIDAGLQIYFCDPRSPRQRGTNENTNGLLRQYFPKGTDLSAHSVDDLAAVAAALNSRPRKALNWKTPAEALDAVLAAVQDGVATTT